MPRNIPRWIYRADVGPRTRIVLVEPKNEGNVGAVARAMKNFDASDLVLVNPCPLGIEARQRAMHGVDILESARVFPDLASALKDADLIVGTSGIDTESEKRFPRIAIGPRDLAIKVHDVQGTIALLFGREDFGLLEEGPARDVGFGEGKPPRGLCRPPEGDRVPGPQGRAHEDHVPPDDRPSRPERLGVPRVDGRAPEGDEANPTTRGEPLDALTAADDYLTMPIPRLWSVFSMLFRPSFWISNIERIASMFSGTTSDSWWTAWK